jgi:hypothetical protein
VNIRAELRRRGHHMLVNVMTLGERDGVPPGIYTISACSRPLPF